MIVLAAMSVSKTMFLRKLSPTSQVPGPPMLPPEIEETHWPVSAALLTGRKAVQAGWMSSAAGQLSRRYSLRSRGSMLEQRSHHISSGDLGR